MRFSIDANRFVGCFIVAVWFFASVVWLCFGFDAPFVFGQQHLLCHLPGLGCVGGADFSLVGIDQSRRLFPFACGGTIANSHFEVVCEGKKVLFRCPLERILAGSLKKRSFAFGRIVSRMSIGGRADDPKLVAGRIGIRRQSFACFNQIGSDRVYEPAAMGHRLQVADIRHQDNVFCGDFFEPLQEFIDRVDCIVRGVLAIGGFANEQTAIPFAMRVQSDHGMAP